MKGRQSQSCIKELVVPNYRMLVSAGASVRARQRSPALTRRA